MLAYELYLKNKESTVEVVKIVVPIKKVFVKANDMITIQLDSKTLEHYGENLNPKAPNSYFQESLSMPSNNLASVGLPYRGTGAAAKKPYVELYGRYKKSKLALSLAGEGKGHKEEYEYVYNFERSKEFITTPVDLLVLRLDKKTYYVNDKLLFDVYKEAGVITSEGALASKVFLEISRAFSTFWKEKIAFEEPKEPSREIYLLCVDEKDRH